MDEIEVEADLEEGPHEDMKGMLMDSIRRKLETLPGNPKEAQKFTIFRIPKNIRTSKAHLFEPSVISIGPYYHGLPHLCVMEEQKWRFLRDFLSRGNGVGVEDCIGEVKALESQTRGCYSEPIKMNSDTFVEMILLDGCFILEYLLKLVKEPFVPVEGAGWSSWMIPNDLILMENQIPFFILQRLHRCICGQDLDPELLKTTVRFLIDEMVSTKVYSSPIEIHHLLHLCHRYIVPTQVLDHESPSEPKRTKHGRPWPTWVLQGPKRLFKSCVNLPMANEITPELHPARSKWSIPCATQLKEAGVMFRRKAAPSNFTDVTFKSGVLEIPFLEITDTMTTRFMNLVALEQCRSLKVPKVLTSYRLFMDAIVNTTNDVLILQRRGIISSMLSSEEEVALFFNQTGQGVYVSEEHYLSELFEDVNRYCESKRHRYRAKLFHNYLNSPWAILSLAAGIILLLLTFTQTFYSAFAYHRPPK